MRARTAASATVSGTSRARVVGVVLVEVRPARVAPVVAVQLHALAGAAARSPARRLRRSRASCRARRRSSRLRAACTNAAATPAAASSPAPTAASVAGTTFSWIGDSALAGSAVALGRLGEQEERAEPARQRRLGRVAGAVQVGALDAALVQRGDAPLGDVDELVVGRRTGSSPSGRPSRTPAPGRPRAGRNRACTWRRGRRRGRGRRRRTGTTGCSSRSRCRRRAGARRCRTRSGSARPSGTRPCSRRSCSACRRRT